MKKSGFPAVRFFLIFFAVLMALRLGLAVFEKNFFSMHIWVKKRIHQSLQALEDERVRNPNLVLFLGMSEAELGFNPIAFDNFNKHKELDTYSLNLAVRNVGTFKALYYERIKYELNRLGLRPRVLFVQIAPATLTKRSTSSSQEAIKYINIVSSYFHAALWKSEFISIQDKIQQGFNKYVLGERSLLQFVYVLQSYFSRTIFGENMFDGRAAAMWNDEAFRIEPPWDWETRGHFHFAKAENKPAVKKFLGYLKTEEGFKKYYDMQIACCDFYELEPDEEHIEEAVRALRELKTVTDRLVLIQFPENPRVPREGRSLERFNTLAQKVADGVGVELWQVGFLGRPFPPSNFIDQSHFSPQGNIDFAQRLSMRLAKNWQEPAD